jgi:hypothetical protein
MSDGMMFLPKSCWLSDVGRVVLERLHQDVGLEDVDAHRRQRQFRRARDGRAVPPASPGTPDAVVFVHAHDAESPPVGHRHFQRRQRASAFRSRWNRSILE